MIDPVQSAAVCHVNDFPFGICVDLGSGICIDCSVVLFCYEKLKWVVGVGVGVCALVVVVVPRLLWLRKWKQWSTTGFNRGVLQRTRLFCVEIHGQGQPTSHTGQILGGNLQWCRVAVKSQIRRIDQNKVVEMRSNADCVGSCEVGVKQLYIATPLVSIDLPIFIEKQQHDHSTVEVQLGRPIVIGVGTEMASIENEMIATIATEGGVGNEIWDVRGLFDETLKWFRCNRVGQGGRCGTKIFDTLRRQFLIVRRSPRHRPPQRLLELELGKWCLELGKDFCSCCAEQTWVEASLDCGVWKGLGRQCGAVGGVACGGGGGGGCCDGEE